MNFFSYFGYSEIIVVKLLISKEESPKNANIKRIRTKIEENIHGKWSFEFNFLMIGKRMKESITEITTGRNTEESVLNKKPVTITAKNKRS